MFNVVAYQVASAINIRDVKSQLNLPLLFSDSDELFYQSKTNKFLYIFQYGVICFFNLTLEEIELYMQMVRPFFKVPITERISEDITVELQENLLKVEFQSIILPALDLEMVRLIMLNVSQSVALDMYSELSENLLLETHKHTQFLENNGKLDISGNKLKRFIGKTLNIKNKISENLYIFDSPDSTWENEQLNRLNVGLKQTFDLKDRYRIIHDRIEIIKENLELFKDIMDHNESNKLEWIIIILILVEVVDMFIAKLFF
ncbi:RMD1 family protein [Formosa sp. S-31]|uniref:RMD1 family protein n=1 Tax=Formosa sp. S-31 TaxID=2790949 RepID=UPI003EBDF375